MKSTGSKSTCLTFSHLWTIANFSHLYDEKCQWKGDVESEEFTVPKNKELEFSLRICPKVKGEDGEEYLGVGLSTEEIPDRWEGKVTMKEKWYLVNKKRKKLWCKEYEEREMFNNRLTDGEYLPVEKLRDSSAGYLKGGTLRVLCEMTLHSPEAVFTSADKAHTFSYTAIPHSAKNDGGTHITLLIVLQVFNKLCFFFFGDNATNTNINNNSEINHSPSNQSFAPNSTEPSPSKK